jgi:predicted enzyme related to lactoylglutathione lyase
MHKSRLAALVIDCRNQDLTALGRFWSEALGYRIAAEQPDERYLALEGPSGEVTVLLQRVEHDPRVHLDIESDDIEAEARRLEALGAKRVAAIKGWIVLEAPSGHRFCVVKPQRPDFDSGAKAW